MPELLLSTTCFHIIQERTELNIFTSTMPCQRLSSVCTNWGLSQVGRCLSNISAFHSKLQKNAFLWKERSAEEYQKARGNWGTCSEMITLQCHLHAIWVSQTVNHTSIAGSYPSFCPWTCPGTLHFIGNLLVSAVSSVHVPPPFCPSCCGPGRRLRFFHVCLVQVFSWVFLCMSACAGSCRITSFCVFSIVPDFKQ